MLHGGIRDCFFIISARAEGCGMLAKKHRLAFLASGTKCDSELTVLTCYETTRVET